MSLPTNIIFAARHLLTQGYAEIARDRARLSQSDLSVLLVVYDQPGITAKVLAERLGRVKTTVSRSVSRLTALGLVRSETDILDGRLHDLFLTTEGHAITQRAANRVREEIERLTDDMTSENVEVLNVFLTGLISNEQ